MWDSLRYAVQKTFAGVAITQNMETTHDTTNPWFGTRKTLTIGGIAVMLALLINPLLAAGGVLHFVLGMIVAFVAPPVFGVFAVVAAVQLYRLDESRQAATVTILALVATLIGIVLGLWAVF